MPQSPGVLEGGLGTLLAACLDGGICGILLAQASWAG